MSPDVKEALLKLVNSSGYLFQLRVEDEITRTSAIHGKTVLAREHKWTGVTTHDEGFIDLVLKIGTNGRMVVECKRVIDGTWLFLVPNGATAVKKANLLWSYKLEDNRQIAAWDELKLNPESMESSFCIIRGQGEKDQPMLERISSILLRSVESLAEEEQKYPHPAGLPGVRFYIPAIITTAKLQICIYDVSKIDLATGQIPDAEFEEVPFLRFTKSMSTRLLSSKPPQDLVESAKEAQRTVLVINAGSLSPTLNSKWEFEGPQYSDEFWPWERPVWKQKG